MPLTSCAGQLCLPPHTHLPRGAQLSHSLQPRSPTLARRGQHHSPAWEAHQAGPSRWQQGWGGTGGSERWLAAPSWPPWYATAQLPPGPSAQWGGRLQPPGMERDPPKRGVRGGHPNLPYHRDGPHGGECCFLHTPQTSVFSLV